MNNPQLEKLWPLIFVKFFANCLTMPFFSQYILNLAHSAHMSPHLASIAYVIYTIFFVLTIVPSGYLVEVKNVKTILLAMLVAEGLAFFAFGIFSSFWLIFVLQIFMGVVIPFSSSAEYAYIFAFSDETNRAYTLSVYGNIIRGAMVAGLLLGSSLLSIISMRSLFLLAAILIFGCAIYGFFLLPKIYSKIFRFNIFKTVRKNFFSIIKDSDFLLAALFVSFPLGFVVEGLVLFGMPILLAKHALKYPMIGYMMVLFSLGFFVSNQFIAKRADKHKVEKKYMFLGVLGVLFSIALITYYKLPILILGLFALGVFNGFMFATSMSLVSKSKTAHLLGKNVTGSIYRLFEFFGRIAGPLVISFLILHMASSSI